MWLGPKSNLTKPKAYLYSTRDLTCLYLPRPCTLGRSVIWNLLKPYCATQHDSCYDYASNSRASDDSLTALLAWLWCNRWHVAFQRKRDMSLRALLKDACMCQVWNGGLSKLWMKPPSLVLPWLHVRKTSLQSASAGCCQVHFSEVVLGGVRCWHVMRKRTHWLN